MDSFDTQAIYEAVGIARSRHLVSDTIIFCYPAYPIVCIGYHEEIEKVVDVKFCEENNIPIIRRILGGGAVLLDSDQLFYQMIVDHKNPIIPFSIEDAFKVLLQGPVDAYRRLGIPAEYRAINDIQVKGRKISGNGATTLDNIFILTGNLIFDFNYDLMGRVLKVPSEKFRDKMVKSMKEWVTTIKRELGKTVAIEEAKKALKRGFEKSLDITLQPKELTDEENKILEDLRGKYHSREWLLGPALDHFDLIMKRKVKIAGEIRIGEAHHKVKGGLIRVTTEIAGDIIRDIMITGDFWFYPKEKLIDMENSVKGSKIEEPELFKIIKKFYKENNIETPGVFPEDFVTVILESAH